MDNTSHDAIAGSDNCDPIVLEPALDTPHFDEESIQHARPAVPLEQIRARRFWPLAAILMCGATVFGAIVGVTVSRYEKRSEQISTPAGTVASEESRVSTGSGSDRIMSSTPENESNDALSPSVADADKKTVADSEEKANETRPATANGNAEATRAAARPRDNTAADGEPIRVTPERNVQATLNGALNEWIAATNAGDIQRQMDFYHPTMNAFYLKRNVPRAAVRAEKSRVFSHANLIDIRAATPGIHVSPDGQTATMRFRKKYAIEGGDADRRGEVLQELRWVRTDDGWKIVSERDLRVLH